MRARGEVVGRCWKLQTGFLVLALGSVTLPACSSAQARCLRRLFAGGLVRRGADFGSTRGQYALLVSFLQLPEAYAVLEGRRGATVRALPVPPTTERAA
jgi:hypothetical protein